MKSANWISAIGRRPPIAAPIEVPMIWLSVSGVSITRSSPNSAHRPSVARKTPPFLPTSSPRTITFSSRTISSRMPSRIASMKVLSAISGAGRHRPRDSFAKAPRRRCLRRPVLGEDPLHGGCGLRIRLRLRIVGRVVDVGLDRRLDPRLDLLREDPGLDQLGPEARHGVVRSLRGELLLRAVLRLLVIARMGGQPGDLGLDERRTVAGSRSFDGVPGGGGKGEDVGPVAGAAGILAPARGVREGGAGALPSQRDG